MVSKSWLALLRLCITIALALDLYCTYYFGYVWLWQIFAFLQTVATGLLVAPAVLWVARKTGKWSSGTPEVALAVVVPVLLLFCNTFFLRVRIQLAGPEQLIQESKALVAQRREQDEGPAPSTTVNWTLPSRDPRLGPALARMVNGGYAKVTTNEVEIKLGGGPDSYVGLHVCPDRTCDFEHGTITKLSEGLFLVDWDMPTQP